MIKPEMMPLYIVPITMLGIGKHLWETLVSKPLKDPDNSLNSHLREGPGQAR